MMVGENGVPETPDWDIALVRARVAADNGIRHNLDDVIRELGFDPEELRSETHLERGTN